MENQLDDEDEPLPLKLATCPKCGDTLMVNFLADHMTYVHPCPLTMTEKWNQMCQVEENEIPYGDTIDGLVTGSRTIIVQSVHRPEPKPKPPRKTKAQKLDGSVSFSRTYRKPRGGGGGVFRMASAGAPGLGKKR